MMKTRELKELFIINYSLLIILASCSVSKQIAKQADTILLKDSSISTGFIGISIYEPATGKYWYNYNAMKNFIPASNTKLFSLYAGMKYLGDSLTGIYYQDLSDTVINIFPTGDPSFLHEDFKRHPVLDFLKGQNKTIYVAKTFTENALGLGWAWDDYNDDYMVERNPFPVYGNTLKIETKNFTYTGAFSADINWKIIPSFFESHISNSFLLPYNYIAAFKGDSVIARKELLNFDIIRERSTNHLNINKTSSKFTKQEIPFVTDGVNTVIEILNSQFGLKLKPGSLSDNSLYGVTPPHSELHKIKSQLTDSLFKPMMHRSDNFFAEQTLLMASNERLGYMSDQAIIDTLLTTDLKDLPQRPKWVDGSGLSRYNLFTPQAFIYILNKMRNEFGMPRLKTILPTGGEGTLKSYYKKDSSFIYAKTGTLSNNCALSGFLTTNSGKLLIFSILANHYQTGATPIRQAVERFLTGVREKY